MNAIKDGGQALPIAGYEGETTMSSPVPGMSLRDYFAAKAMPMLAEKFYSTGGVLSDGNVPQLVSKVAYQFADAMLAAREVKS